MQKRQVHWLKAKQSSGLFKLPISQQNLKSKYKNRSKGSWIAVVLKGASQKISDSIDGGNRVQHLPQDFERENIISGQQNQLFGE